MHLPISSRKRQLLFASLLRFVHRCLTVRPIVASLMVIYVINHVNVVHELSRIFEDPTTTLTERMKSTTTGKASQRLSGRRRENDSSTSMSDGLTRLNSSSIMLREGSGPYIVIEETSERKSISRSLLPDVRYSRTFEDIRDAVDAGNHTTGQELLDFGIIGFPKCGTTTMMRWLGMHPEISALQREIMALQRQHPALVLRFIMNELPEGRYLRGYKSPNDVEDQRALNKLAQHYPKTKLIVGIRHPVLWFESFYNHRIQNGMTMPNMINMSSSCQGGYHGVCIARSAFHNSLVRLGKTPLGYDNSNQNTKQVEWSIFSRKEQRSIRHDLPVQQGSPNPIFLYETSQLNAPTQPETTSQPYTTNQQGYENFVKSIKAFLGVSLDFPPMIQSKPGRKGLNATEQARRNALKVNICLDVYKEHRELLLGSGKRTKEWILGYFLKSPDVMVGNIEQFRDILETYDVDPCLERSK